MEGVPLYGLSHIGGEISPSPPSLFRNRSLPPRGDGARGPGAQRQGRSCEMLIEKYDGRQERSVLIAMIVDDKTLGWVSSKWRKEKGSDGPFLSRWSNVVGRFCVRYYHKYGRAPRRNI